MEHNNQTTFIFSPFFYPEPISTGKYNTSIAKVLVEMGESVSVCCSYPLYPEWLPRKIDIALPGVSIFRGGEGLRYPKNSKTRRLILECWFSIHSIIVFFRFRKTIHRIIAIFPPSLFYFFLQLFLGPKVKKIGIVHDLQGLLGLSGNGTINRVFSFLVKKVETICFRNCDRLILLSEIMKMHVVNQYGIGPDKCVVYYPFVSNSIMYNGSKRLIRLFPDGFKHIVYSGAIGDKQNAFELLNLFELLVDKRNDVICHFFTRGPLLTQIKQVCKSCHQERILFHDLVDEDDLPELFFRSTIQIIPQKPGTSDGAFPSKLSNLLAAEVPVFALTDPGSEVQMIVDASGIGQSCTTWEELEVLPVLSKFIDRVAVLTQNEKKTIVGKYLKQTFDIKNLIREILSV